MELKFKVDAKHRKDWFTEVSFSHPAKMSLPLQLWIIENYTKAGETILDPMAGSGTVLVACSLGRNVIAIELEQKFVDIMNGNWEKIKQHGAQLGYSMGTCQIIQGDARQLENILCDKIITSPPFSEAGKQLSGKTPLNALRTNPRRKGEKLDWVDYQKGENPSNISNLPYGNIDSIITSPPYEAAVTGKDGIDWSKGTRGVAGGSKPRDRSKEPAFEHLSIGGAGFAYSKAKDNIGNLKSESYLEAMEIVYRNCLAVLKPQGLMILVVKNFLRNQVEIRLDSDTISLCERAGFHFVERHYRVLPSQSFWRVIYAKKFPLAPVIDREHILIFVKT